MRAALHKLSRVSWLLQSRLELARERHASQQHYAAEAGYCIALIVAHILIGGPK